MDTTGLLMGSVGSVFSNLKSLTTLISNVLIVVHAISIASWENLTLQGFGGAVLDIC